MMFCKAVLLLSINLLSVSLLCGMESQVIHYTTDDANPIISNTITVRNCTKRNLGVAVVTNGKCRQWIDTYKVWDEVLLNFEKVRLLKANEKANLNFSKFLRYPYIQKQCPKEPHFTSSKRLRFLNEQESDIFVWDYRLLTFIARARSSGLTSESLVTEIIQTKKILSCKIEFPDKFDSINFTLDLCDGPNEQLEESEFFITIVE